MSTKSRALSAVQLSHADVDRLQGRININEGSRLITFMILEMPGQRRSYEIRWAERDMEFNLIVSPQTLNLLALTLDGYCSELRRRAQEQVEAYQREHDEPDATL